jgi:tartrate dehydratase beta subunit/fumarate hydratase class I family protein
MKPTGSLRLGIVVGRSPHPQATLDDLWGRAVESMKPREAQLSGTALFVADGGPAPVSPSPRLELVPLAPAGSERLDAFIGALARKGGPLGVAGRLARDNRESRLLARSIAGRAELQSVLVDADVVVAADVSANRAVWELRRRTSASLVRGPIAMMHVLRREAER